MNRPDAPPHHQVGREEEEETGGGQVESKGVGMEPEQRGRTSRASSTSSLGREVRCGCQYYQSDSLLPERRALLGRPPSRTMQQPPAVRCRSVTSQTTHDFIYRRAYRLVTVTTRNTRLNLSVELSIVLYGFHIHSVSVYTYV